MLQLEDTLVQPSGMINTNVDAFTDSTIKCNYKCNITSVILQLEGNQWDDYANAIYTFKATVITEDHFSALIIP